MNRNEAWIQTFTGVAFYPFNFELDDIKIEDIGHSLSMLCRYNGHTEKFYSVAEHCVHASYLVPEEAALHALLHDAAETYTSDVLGPLKKFFPELKNLEKSLTQGIEKKFQLDARQHETIKQADLLMTALEKEQAMGRPPIPWPHLLPEAPKSIELQFWAPDVAKQRFMDRFVEVESWTT